MKNILIIFILLISFNSFGQSDLEEYVERMESVFQERHKQVMEERENFIKYGSLAYRKGNCVCSYEELEEEYRLEEYITQVKRWSQSQANLYRNCGQKTLLEQGKWIIEDFLIFINEDILTKEFDRFGFIPYEYYDIESGELVVLSEEQKAEIAADPIGAVFPYKIKDPFNLNFNVYQDSVLTFELYNGFRQDIPVRTVRLESEPLEPEEITDIRRIVLELIQDYWIENTHYIYICPDMEDRFVYTNGAEIERSADSKGLTAIIYDSDYKNIVTSKEFTLEQALNGEIQVWVDTFNLELRDFDLN